MPGKPQEKHAIDEPFSMSDLGRVTLKKAWGHFCTITHHKLLVMRYCFRVGLYRQGLAHDLSKYSPCEFMVGVRYYQGFRSPNSAERAVKGYSEAWMHHKGRNRHHWEYWVDIKGNGDPTMEGKPMPTRYVVEMFCDRIAASRVYKKDAYTDRSPLERMPWRASDASIALEQGCRAVTLCGVQDGVPANAHWTGDSPEKLDMNAIEDAVDMVVEVIKNA